MLRVKIGALRNKLFAVLREANGARRPCLERRAQPEWRTDIGL